VILYLYAIAVDLESIDGLSGIRDEALQRLGLEDVDVVGGEIEAAPVVAASALERQDEVVRRLHARAGALLPMRFGAAFESEGEMRRVLALRLPTLRQRLASVTNGEQMALRILGTPGDQVRPGAAGCDQVRPGAAGAAGAPGAPGAAGAAGAEYLRARAARAVPPGIASLLDALKPLARETRVEPGKASGVIATVYQLIDRGTSAEYAAAVKAVAGARPDLSIRVTGPAPCYAFT
jgi:hypothetical protein